MLHHGDAPGAAAVVLFVAHPALDAFKKKRRGRVPLSAIKQGLTVTHNADTREVRAAEIELLRTLPELLFHHLDKRPEIPIYKFYDQRTKEWTTLNVREVCERVLRWARAFTANGFKKGDRVAMLLPNGIDAICFDMGALTCGLVPVPLHAIDTPGSSAYILNDSGATFLVTNRLAKWQAIAREGDLPALRCVVITDEAIETSKADGRTLTNADHWLSTGGTAETTPLPEGPEPSDLAALVYTSGTTGRPKGVMLTHRTILSDIVGVKGLICPESEDVWFSFLPLSHTFERTTTYYFGLGMGNLVGFNRNIGLLQEDMRIIRPTIMMCVPRVFEKIYSKIHDRLVTKSAFVRFMFNWAVDVGYRRFCRRNGLPVQGSALSFLDPLVAGFLASRVSQGVRNIFGGRPRAVISGGAALSGNIARTFIGLGVEIIQGYGMTEASPVISVNRFNANHPNTVGVPLENIEVKLGDNDELMVKGPIVMKGYWNRPEDTRAILSEDGWLKTGDQADIYSDGRIRIKGRIKEIIVTSTGEKIPPADLEQAIETDHLFEQVMAVGEDRPYIAVLAVVNQEALKIFLNELGKDPDAPDVLMDRDVRTAALRRIKALSRNFPNYGVPRNVRLLSEPWTIENGMLTPTLKLKRGRIREKYANEIAELYGDRRN